MKPTCKHSAARRPPSEMCACLNIKALGKQETEPHLKSVVTNKYPPLGCLVNCLMDYVKNNKRTDARDQGIYPQQPNPSTDTPTSRCFISEQPWWLQGEAANGKRWRPSWHSSNTQLLQTADMIYVWKQDAFLLESSSTRPNALLYFSSWDSTKSASLQLLPTDKCNALISQEVYLPFANSPQSNLIQSTPSMPTWLKQQLHFPFSKPRIIHQATRVLCLPLTLTKASLTNTVSRDSRRAHKFQPGWISLLI